MSLQGLRKGLLLRRPSLAARPVRSASMKTNPAADPLGPLETMIGLSAFFLVTLIPTGYFFVNLESYKTKE